MKSTPTYITLAHELAHVEDYLHGMTPKLLGPNIKMKDIWIPGRRFKDIFEGEKYATYIENLIRNENKLQLRTHYGVRIDERGFENPTDESRILDFRTQKHMFIDDTKFEIHKPRPEGGDNPVPLQDKDSGPDDYLLNPRF